MSNLFSDNILWSIGIIAGGLGVIAAHRLIVYRERRIKIIEASKPFRDAINIDRIDRLSGHQLENILLGVTAGDGTKIEGEFSKHKKAFGEYIVYLGWLDRFCLNRAWKEYTGGNNNHPDLFKMYCLPDNGPKLLKHRLLKLRKFGEKH